MAGLLTKTVGDNHRTFYGDKSVTFTDKDQGKAVTIAAMGTIKLAGADDAILGFLTSVEVGTFKGHQTLGVAIDNFQLADTTGLAAGDAVVVASAPANGTAGLSVMKKADAGVASNWVVVDDNLLFKL